MKELEKHLKRLKIDVQNPFDSNVNILLQVIEPKKEIYGIDHQIGNS